MIVSFEPLTGRKSWTTETEISIEKQDGYVLVLESQKKAINLRPKKILQQAKDGSFKFRSSDLGGFLKFSGSDQLAKLYRTLTKLTRNEEIEAKEYDNRYPIIVTNTIKDQEATDLLKKTRTEPVAIAKVTAPMPARMAAPMPAKMTVQRLDPVTPLYKKPRVLSSPIVTPSPRKLERRPLTEIKRIAVGEQLEKSILGFKNLGHTCYMASVIQMLYYSKFLDCLSPSDDPVCQQLLEIRQHKQASEKASLRGLKQAFGTFFPKFRPFCQEDAHEFLVCLLDHLSEHKSNTKPLEFEIETHLQCNGCTYASKNRELFRVLSLELLRDFSTVQELLDAYFAPETVSYQCETCEAKTGTLKRQFVSKPQILMIHLKRFAKTYQGTQKRQDPVRIDLALQSHRLRGIVSHLGQDMFSGHYVFDYLDKKWMTFDDQYVGETEDRQIKRRSTGFILMYRLDHL